MKKRDALGQFEQLVLTAVLLCRENAYGIPVHRKVEQLGERPVKPPSVYITLGRLQEKGYVRSRFADPTPERGGKRKRYFRVLAAGERALADSAATAERLLHSWKTLLCKRKHPAGK
jgi:PadR family transcriptional regulator, regulatory protein PadR